METTDDCETGKPWVINKNDVARLQLRIVDCYQLGGI